MNKLLSYSLIVALSLTLFFGMVGNVWGQEIYLPNSGLKDTSKSANVRSWTSADTQAVNNAVNQRLQGLNSTQASQLRDQIYAEEIQKRATAQNASLPLDLRTAVSKGNLDWYNTEIRDLSTERANNLNRMQEIATSPGGLEDQTNSEEYQRLQDRNDQIIKETDSLTKQRDGAESQYQKDKKNETSSFSLWGFLDATAFFKWLSSFFWETLILPIFGFFMNLAGALMDYSLTLSLNVGKTDSIINNGMSSIQTGWTILRDAANIIFIFVLLYISISTILRVGSYSGKQMLVKVIIAALLVNFSLVTTKIVIDFGNAAAVGIYNSIQEKTGGKTLSDYIKASINPEKSYYANAETLADVAQANLSGFFRLVIMILLIFIFIVISFLFIGRIVAFFFLLMLSPIGFVGHLLPKVSSYRDKWWNELFSQSFSASIFLIFMLGIVSMLKNGILEISYSNYKISQAGSIGEVASTLFQKAVELTLPTVVVAAMIIVAYKITKSLSGEVGKVATNIGGAAIGLGIAAATGGAAMAGRATLGRIGASVARSEKLKETATKGNFLTKNFAKATIATGKKASESTFDARNAKTLGSALGKVEDIAGTNLGGTTKGFLAPKSGLFAPQKKGGYEQMMKDRQKAMEERTEMYAGKAPKKEDLDKARNTIEESRKNRAEYSDKFRRQIAQEAEKSEAYRNAQSKVSEGKSQIKDLEERMAIASPQNKSAIATQIQSVRNNMKQFTDTVDKMESEVVNNLVKESEKIVKVADRREGYLQSEVEKPGIMRTVVGPMKYERIKLANDIRKGNKVESDKDKLFSEMKKVWDKKEEESGGGGDKKGEEKGGEKK